MAIIYIHVLNITRSFFYFHQSNVEKHADDNKPTSQIQKKLKQMEQNGEITDGLLYILCVTIQFCKM